MNCPPRWLTNVRGFVGGLFKEAQTLALAKAYQDATTWHLQHPTLKFE
jgi:hypothetical protein